jgi:transposase
MEFTFFIGIDISKDELDFAISRGPELLFHREIKNSPKSITQFLAELSKVAGFSFSKAVFCMEHTGIYNNHILLALHKKQVHVCLENSVQIKCSLGKLRGKNDKIDSIRIAEYAYEKREKLRLWVPKREVVQQLARLSTIRTRLISAKKMLAVPAKESDLFLEKSITKNNAKLFNSTIKTIQLDIEKTEKAIMNIVDADDELKRLFLLITSVDGIGKVTAVQILITTNEFKEIDSPKSFACYAGVAPFSDDSGKVIKKPRISHMANKKMKTLLHLSALVAIQHNADLNKFYRRKVEIEKKNKMSVINAVRNKLILRIFACVNQNRKYEENYQKFVA